MRAEVEKRVKVTTSPHADGVVGLARQPQLMWRPATTGSRAPGHAVARR